MPTKPEASDSSEQAAPSGPRPRSDAVRNRQRLIEAAMQAFAEEGLEVGVAEIARRAGVGTGTVFRNFPTKDDLVHAVVEAKMAQLMEIGERALEVDDAGAALEQFLTEIADVQAADRGFFEALETRVIDDPELLECKQGMLQLGARLLERAQESGAIRADVVPEDLRFLILAAVRTDAGPVDAAPDSHRRYLRIILDGVRAENASELTVRPPRLI